MKIAIKRSDGSIFIFKDPEDFVIDLICDFNLSAGQKIKIGKGKEITLTKEMIESVDRELRSTRSFKQHFAEIVSLIKEA